MPEHEIHEYIDWIFFGRTFPRVHDRIDEPIKFLGFRHREWFHDYPTAGYIARQEYPFCRFAECVGWLHVWTDDECTRKPDLLKLLRVYRLFDLEKMKTDLMLRELCIKFILKELDLEDFYWFFSDLM
jgi:hypothetical protein